MKELEVRKWIRYETLCECGKPYGWMEGDCLPFTVGCSCGRFVTLSQGERAGFHTAICETKDELERRLGNG